MVLLVKQIMSENVMFSNKKSLILILIFFYLSDVQATNKDNIIQNLNNIENISFNFEQNINDQIEKGSCKILYPKKIYCKYDNKNNKILVSNGRSLVVKTMSSYYIYPLKKTPLDLILDKNFLIKKIKDIPERVIENKFINFKFIENENEINIFFDNKNFNLIGWQTSDVYQNLSITYLYSIEKNQSLDKNIFNLPKKD